MLEIGYEDSLMAPARRGRMPMMLRVSAMVGVSLVLWGAILGPFIA